MVKKRDVVLLMFDFDGTVVDSKSLYYEAMKKGLNTSDEKEIKKFMDKGLTINETLREMGFSKLRSCFLKIKIMREIFKNLNNVKKCKDVSSIKGIKKKKIIVSNSYNIFINKVLKKLKLKKYFSEVYGANDFEEKTRFIRDYLKREKVDPKRVFYIGDRKVDVELAKNVGCFSVAIIGKCAWDSRKEVLKEKPDFVIGSLKDLEDILK